jgi:hypothetical protein
MLVALEKAKLSEQQLSVQANANAELQMQLEILRDTIKLYEEQIAVYKSMADMNNRMGDMKDKACADQVKAATPTFIDNLGKYSVGGVIGAIITVVIMLL